MRAAGRWAKLGAMKHLAIAVTLAATLIPALPQKTGNPFAGRWDMTVTKGNDTFPSWMEVVEQGGNLQVRAQGRTGNVNPAEAVKMDGSRLLVTVVAASPARPELVWELAAKGGQLTGTERRGDSVAQITGVRAPSLQRAAPAAWADAEPLFNGKDLTGWQPINNTPDTMAGPLTSHWIAKGGELVNEAKGSNLRTTRTFNDFKLHVEWLCPAGENSGIYLRGRYETQVAPPPAEERQRAAKGGAGAFPRNPYLGVACIYGMLGPASPPPFRPDWQTYDITLIGRWVTVVFNGITTIDNGEIAGVTGGALDSNEAEPGPIYLQGDHHGGIRYRNIRISVPRR
jgi:hypothetical protein